MKANRRDILKLVTAAGAGITALGAGATTVTEEMRRRLQYLTPPGGTPPDLLARPSPPIDPWQDYDLQKLRPAVARPLFSMVGEVSPDDPVEAPLVGLAPGDAPVEITTLPDEKWQALFESRFKAAAKILSKDGFTVPDNWTVRGDAVNDGKVRIDIGVPPDPEAHQRYFEFRPRHFYINREAEFQWEYHPQYGPESYSWGFHNIYADENGGYSSTLPTSPGPTFQVRYGEPVLVRRFNDLPEIGNQAGDSVVRFALPSTTSHLHNAHTASESDGFPNDWINPGQYWDHHYANFPSGHDEREKLTTLWYHDHRMDFTAANVYAGLAGFYLFFDERPEAGTTPDTGDLNDEMIGWRLPAGDYDIPLIFQDILFAGEEEVEDGNGKPYSRPRKITREQSTRWTFESAQEWDDASEDRGRVVADGTHKAIRHVGFDSVKGDVGVDNDRYTPSPGVIFDGFNIDGVLGDRWTTNRRIQPRYKVEPRKYRIRFLNGGPSRFYELFLHATNVPKENRERVYMDASDPDASMTRHQMLIIAGDGNFQSNPVIADSLYLGVAQRADVIIDFSEFGPGSKVYVVNCLEQENGAGPTERRILETDFVTDQDFLDANGLVLFEVGEATGEDTSRFPLLLRDEPPVNFSEVQRERVWEFDYDGGLWTINGNIFDPNRIDAGIDHGTAEIWKFQNAGTNWHHPIHSHFTEFIIIEENGRPFNSGSIQTRLIPSLPDFLANRKKLKKMAVQKDGVMAEAIQEESMAAEAETGYTDAEEMHKIFPPMPEQSLRDMEDQFEQHKRSPTEESQESGNAPSKDWREIVDQYWAEALEPYLRKKLGEGDTRQERATPPSGVQNIYDRLISFLTGLENDAARLDIVLPLALNRPQAIKFLHNSDYVAFAEILVMMGLSSPVLPDPGRFMGGARRDVALLLPGTEVTVFMRWRDFMGRYVMHCHNVVHEDHAMMVRWDIVPKGQGFETPRHVDNFAEVGEPVKKVRQDHIESRPARGTAEPDDS